LNPDVTFQTNDKELVKNMHNCECEAYQLLGIIGILPVPQTYYIEVSSDKMPGMIIMEDMNLKTRQMSVFDSATAQQCADFAEKLADFQVCRT
jgi:hypothetical protein